MTRECPVRFWERVGVRLPRATRQVCLMIRGTKHWLWRAVDQDGIVLDVLVQSRRDKKAAKRLLRKLLKKQGRAPRVLITDKLASYSAAKGEVMPLVEHRRHKGFVWGHPCQGSSSAAAFLRFCWAGRRLRACMGPSMSRFEFSGSVPPILLGGKTATS